MPCSACSFVSRTRAIEPNVIRLPSFTNGESYASSGERRALIKNHGAEIELVSKEQGGFSGCVRIAEAMKHFDDVFLPRAFENRYNVEAHEKTTGREIGHYLL